MYAIIECADDAMSARRHTNIDKQVGHRQHFFCSETSSDDICTCLPLPLLIAMRMWREFQKCV